MWSVYRRIAVAEKVSEWIAMIIVFLICGSLYVLGFLFHVILLWKMSFILNSSILQVTILAEPRKNSFNWNELWGFWGGTSN